MMACSWRTAGLREIVFQPYRSLPTDLPPLFIVTAGERLHPFWKRKLFLCVRSETVANRRHGSTSVPSMLKRNASMKPLTQRSLRPDVSGEAARLHKSLNCFCVALQVP
jgi:hypothetical protein